jgi:hypothetical protein
MSNVPKNEGLAMANHPGDLVAIGVFFLFWIAIVTGWIRIAKITGLIIAGVMVLGILVSILSNFDGFLEILGAIALFWILGHVIIPLFEKQTPSYLQTNPENAPSEEHQTDAASRDYAWEVGEYSLSD